MKVKLSVLLVGLCLASSASYAVDAPPVSEYLYTVQPGDNLSTFAQNILDSSKRWPEVAKYNKLKNPQVITPGQVLHIQLPWLKNSPAEARIESLTGAVMLNGQTAKVGDKVLTGAQLETPAGASARMSLPDGSTLNMLEKTQLQATALEQKKQGNFFSSLFRLTTGRIDAIKKKYPEGQAPLRIQAMHGTIGVRGTHFRMGQENGNTLAEIENGLVSFGDEAKAAPIALAAAQGSVGDGVHAPEMIPLLDAPKFPDLSIDFPPELVSFTMPELAGAKGYRGELASDENFLAIIAPVSAASPLIQFSNLAEGTYFLRLRAVDEHGLQGMTSATKLVIKKHIAAPALKVEIKPTSLSFVGNRLRIVWDGEPGLQYECQMTGTHNFNFPLVDIIVKQSELSIPTPEAGAYLVRVRAINSAGMRGDWSEPMSFNVH